MNHEHNAAHDSRRTGRLKEPWRTAPIAKACKFIGSTRDVPACLARPKWIDFPTGNRSTSGPHNENKLRDSRCSARPPQDLHQLYQWAKLWDDSSLKTFTTKVGKLPLKHFPFNEHKLFETFATAYYSTLE